MDLLALAEEEYARQLEPTSVYVAMAQQIRPLLQPDMSLTDAAKSSPAWALNKLGMHLCVRSLFTSRVKGHPSPLELVDRAGARCYAEMEKAIYRPGEVKTAGNYPLHRMVLLIKHAAQTTGTPLDRLQWLDLSAGHGDRLIASLLLGVGYDCIDPRAELVDDYARVRSRLGLPCAGARHVVGGSEDPGSYADLSPEYDLVFACPPYFDKELYGLPPAPSGSAAQSVDSFPSFEGWMAGFLLPSLRLGWQRVRPGGVLMVNIAHYLLDPARLVAALEVAPQVVVVAPAMDPGILKQSPIYLWRKP